ncbi:MAG: cytochrome c maturation protein CcmE [bacterium]|jgi:cytochrome c-type biogenesis protein CcmE
MKTRTKFVIGGAAILAVLTLLSVQGLQEMTVFFYTPQEVLAQPRDFEEKTIRIGALVMPGSVDWDAQDIQLAFRITEDSTHSIPVVYKGVKPDMFREGQGVVVEGRIRSDGVFHADQLLVKHSEDYKLDPNHQKQKEDYYKSLAQ